MRLIDADALTDEIMERYCKECGNRKGIKNGKYRIIYEVSDAPCRACLMDDMKDELDNAPTKLRSEDGGGYMNDLISRQAAIDALAKILPTDPMKNEYTKGNIVGVALALKYVMQLPSVQPDTDEEIQKMHDMEQAQLDKAFELGREDAKTEIIHCKDCKYYQFADNRAFGFPVKRCEWTGFEDVDDDDFCSRVERRTDG